MRGLSIRQPYAWLIIYGLKTIENRSWPTTYRGDLVIHAAVNRTDYDNEYHDAPELDDRHFGVLYGIVRLVDCVPVEDVEEQAHAFGPWCWLLKDPRPIEPISFRGKLGLFTVPPEVASQIELAD